MYFRIGELSKICDVTVKTIRFYEKAGLLKPIYVDKFTGYRYYDKTSCTRLLEIIMFKELGFSLKEIKKINVKTIKSIIYWIYIRNTNRNIEAITQRFSNN